MARVHIKICCISSIEEAEMAIESGADAVGLVSAMPSGPGVIAEERINAIARHVGARAETFLLTSLTAPAAIARQWERCGTSVIQLTDALEGGAEGLQELRVLAAGARLVQVIHVCGEDSLAEARAAAAHVDALLLDSGSPKAAVKTLGGTGKAHDWSLSARIVQENGGVPVWLAGGLHSGNAARAVAEVAPHGLDLCSGVRTDGRLDAAKLRAFVNAARGV